MSLFYPFDPPIFQMTFDQTLRFDLVQYSANFLLRYTFLWVLLSCEACMIAVYIRPNAQL
jgi:hypothetical protein